MSSQKINKLQGEFPDLSQSVIGDVLKMCKENQEDAKKALRGIDEETKKENDRKIKELQELFPIASKADVIATLKATEWNVENAILPLFNKTEEIKQQEKKKQEAEAKKKRDGEDKVRKLAETKRQAENLMEIFHSIPKQTVQQMLDENEGDIEETTNQLLAMVAREEEEKKNADSQQNKNKEDEEEKSKREQELRLRELKIQALTQKFEDLSEKEVLAALEKKNWDIKSALAELMLISASKKKKDLKALFPSVSEEQIEAILASHDWDKSKAAQVLTDIRSNSKEEKPKPKESSLSVKKVQQDLLEKSVILAQQMQQEIEQEEEQQKKEDEEEVRALFKNNLEHIIETQARYQNPAPGMAPPPLVKEIDERLAKKPQPISDEEALRIAKDKEAIQKEYDQQLDKSVAEVEQPKADATKCTVVMKATPEVVDMDNEVVVEWEMKNGQSTPNDWIGLYAIDRPNKQYYTYNWRGKNDTSKGTMTFTSPRMYGQFEFRYFVNRSYEHVAMSNRIRVGPQVDVLATIDNSKNKIVVKWKQLSGNTYPRCWIGLYEKSQENNKLYITYERTTSLELQFDIPVKPQEYEFRFFTNSYDDVARSNTIKIEGTDSLVASYANKEVTIVPNILSVDPYYDSVWVGLYFTAQNDNRQWRRYKYVSDRKTEIKFKAPRTAGEYEARLFACKNLNVIAKSNTFAIPDANKK